MNERDLAVLEQYELTVRETYRGRGSYICVTDRGKLLLQEYHGSEKKAQLQQRLLQHLADSGIPNVDVPLCNQGGTVVTKDRDGGGFILKKWMDGRECDVCRGEELKSSAANLAKLHRLMRCPTLQDGQETGAGAQDFSQIAARHNKELKKVRAYVRGKKNKTDFELYFLQYFNMFFEKGVQIQEILSGQTFRELHGHALEEGHYRHGEYSQHNVLFTANGIFTVNFEHYLQDLQLEDLVYFLRKILEKYDWDETVGRTIAEAYDRVNPLSSPERQYVACRLAYPEKFWKLSNRYYNVNKAWISGRNTSKLVKLVVQETKKEHFVRKLAENPL